MIILCISQSINISNLVFSSEVGDEAILKVLLERYMNAVDEVCMCKYLGRIGLCCIEQHNLSYMNSCILLETLIMRQGDLLCNLAFSLSLQLFPLALPL